MEDSAQCSCACMVCILIVEPGDSLATVDLGSYYAILPTNGRSSIEQYAKYMPVKRVEPGFAYHSGRNSEFLSVEQIRNLIREHIDYAFVPI